MTTFRVWAPKPNTVTLVLGDQCIPMTRNDDGWWQTETQTPPDTDYAYSIDGGRPLPDPRSPHQPQGIQYQSLISFGQSTGKQKPAS